MTIFKGGRLSAARIKGEALSIFDLLMLPSDEESLRSIAKIDRRCTTSFVVMVERPCERCGEMTLNDRFCRDCDLEYIVACGTCRECKVWIMAAEFGGPIAGQHKIGCTLKEEPEYTAATDAERWAVFDSRHEQAKEATT